MSGFTPGPWQIHEATRYGDRSQWSEYEIWSQDCDVLVATEVRRAHRDGGLANVRLIAAAPELLEALLQCQEYLRHSLGSTSDVNPFPAMEAAIAKARGEA